MLSIFMLFIYVGAPVALLVQAQKLRAGWVAAKFKDDPEGFLARKRKELTQCAVVFAVSSPAWLIMGLLEPPDGNANERFVIAGVGAVSAIVNYALKSRLPEKMLAKM